MNAMIKIDYNILKEALRPRRKCYRPPARIAECDGGGGAAGAAGGDGGGAAGGEAASAVGSADVLGSCDHSDGGYMGDGCFHTGAKCEVPFHRWEIGNGGSIRKKDKNGKPKKTPYERGIKVVYDNI